MDTYSSYEMHESPFPGLHSMDNEAATMETLESSSHPPLEQRLAAHESSFPAASEAPGSTSLYAQADPRQQYLTPYYTTNYLTTGLDFIPAKPYYDPVSTFKSFPSESPISIGNSEGRCISPSHYPDKKKPKRNTNDCPAAMLLRCDSSEKKEPTAAVEEAGENSNTRQKPCEEKSATSSSPEQHTADYIRRAQGRSRIASNKFRVKKRGQIQRLKSEEEDMERINHELSSCVEDLKSEIHNLKMKLLQHTDCSCSLIQVYIANKAHCYIQNRESHRQRQPDHNSSTTQGA